MSSGKSIKLNRLLTSRDNSSSTFLEKSNRTLEVPSNRTPKYAPSALHSKSGAVNNVSPTPSPKMARSGNRNFGAISKKSTSNSFLNVKGSRHGGSDEELRSSMYSSHHQPRQSKNVDEIGKRYEWSQDVSSNRNKQSK